MKPWPQSLFGQVMASVAIALLIAQAVSVVLLFRASEERRETAMMTTAAFQLVTGAERAERRAQRLETREDRRGGRGGGRNNRRFDEGRDLDRGEGQRPFGGRGLPRRLRFSTSPVSPLLPGEQRDETREAQLTAILAAQGVAAEEVRIVSRRAGDDPLLARAAQRNARFAANPDWRDRAILVAGLRRNDASADTSARATEWEVARVIQPRRDNRALPTLIVQTFIIFGFLMAILFVLLRRITRPLAALTRRVDDFGRTPGSDRGAVPEPLAATGPQDIRQLVTAHNAMESRIAALLDEKDVMLGAIGHDLKTPLAALRVRIESVEDEAERAKMAAGIEDITATLDDILSLARIGRPNGPAESTQLAALTAAIAEEFEDMGKPVTLGDTARIAMPVHVTWIRRALRNLVSNALRYGEVAHVELRRETGRTGDVAVLEVTDKGPGIPADKIADMLEPFTRGEASRNRSTGGAGLGLTIARAIAQQHGGELVLANRDEGGLSAQLRLPID